VMGFSGVHDSLPWSIQCCNRSKFTGAQVLAFLEIVVHEVDPEKIRADGTYGFTKPRLGNFLVIGVWPPSKPAFGFPLPERDF